MSKNVLEIAHFRLAVGKSESDFLQAMGPTDNFLSSQPGFVSRKIVMTDDDDLYDLVEWSSLESAQAAAQKFSSETAPELAGFMACLDMENGFMKHSRIIYQSH